MNHCRCKECREDAGSSAAERALVESRRVMSGIRGLVRRMSRSGTLDEGTALLMDRTRHLHHLLNTTNQPRRERS